MSKPSFTVVQAASDGLPALIVVDTALDAAGEAAAFPWLLLIHLPLQRANQLGLCDRAESERLGDIEDALLERLPDSAYRYVGHVTWKGERVIYLYVADPDQVMRLLSDALDQARQKTIQVSTRRDPTWEEYRALKP